MSEHYGKSPLANAYPQWRYYQEVAKVTREWWNRFLAYSTKGKTMRELTGHKVNGVNDGLTVAAQDGPGPGGASHLYSISFNSGPANDPTDQYVMISFQNGPIKEVGVTGVTHEAVIEILKDRLRGFQSGPYACEDNAEALVHLESAQECLLRRTRARAARGVEGTMTV